VLQLVAAQPLQPPPAPLQLVAAQPLQPPPAPAIGAADPESPDLLKALKVESMRRARELHCEQVASWSAQLMGRSNSNLASQFGQKYS